MDSDALEAIMNSDTPSNKDIMTVLKAMMINYSLIPTIAKDVKEAKLKLENVTERVDDHESRISDLENADNKTLEKVNDDLKEVQISQIASEYNSKQYNIIIYNLPGIGKKEKPRASEAKVHDVLRDVLLIDDADSIAIKNCHRLKGTEQKRLPLIFKLQYMFDKQKIWDSLSNLETYNSSKSD